MGIGGVDAAIKSAREDRGMANMNLFVYAHKRDADGICSAAIIKRAMAALKKEFALDFIDYEPRSDMIAAFEGMKSLPDRSHVVIVDFGCDPATLGLKIAALESVVSKGGAVEWLDHHEWKDDVRKAVSRYATLALAGSKGSDALCGAEIALMRFMPGDPLCKILASIAHDSDLGMWDTDPPTPKYAMTPALGKLITYYNYLSDNARARMGDSAARSDLRGRLSVLVSELLGMDPGILASANGNMLRLPSELQEDLDAYSMRERSKMEDCLKGAVIRTIRGRRTAIGLADPLLSTSVTGHALIEGLGVELAIVLFPDGKISFRRSFTSDAKCNEMAGAFGGGGHEFAAGGNLGHSVAEVNAAAEEIADRLGSPSDS